MNLFTLDMNTPVLRIEIKTHTIDFFLLEVEDDEFQKEFHIHLLEHS